MAPLLNPPEELESVQTLTMDLSKKRFPFLFQERDITIDAMELFVKAKPGVLNFKHIKPCKFFDPSSKGCKIYAARPWSCRIFPFLGIYDSEDKVKMNESCPGSGGDDEGSNFGPGRGPKRLWDIFDNRLRRGQEGQRNVKRSPAIYIKFKIKLKGLFVNMLSTER